eukprot:CAMPEP_0177744134 /NCGR_PEP_ID=MMETSP0484_2-20121128/29571_1 /TAXON_ID=354590 /ORGANISM="Rhodomonas lens, Strain RHODO" /LENGTH=381 /DNA_ID=CAMNT_0019258591 /DNA_START=24 /DNA_END=1169 /DNA_ORIENTATION=+
MAARAMFSIDGSLMEGGGQVVRITSALSALLSINIQISKIRGGRSKPGLAAQHSAGLHLVNAICCGQLLGADIGSQEITLQPSQLSPSPEHFADAKTAGACMLLLQSSLPCCALQPFHTHPLPPLTKLALQGGTNVPFSPQVDYTQHIALPMFAKLCGVKAKLRLVRRGFFPRGGGRVEVEVERGTRITPFELLERGEIVRIYGVAYSCGRVPPHVLQRICSAAEERLRAERPLASLPIDITQEAGGESGGDGCGIVLWAETAGGCRLGGSGLGEKKVKAEEVGARAAEKLIRELSHGGSVDQHLTDQLIIFMGLADGVSSLRAGPLTLHTQTAIRWVSELSGASFKVVEEGGGEGGGTCTGIRFGVVPFVAQTQPEAAKA